MHGYFLRLKRILYDEPVDVSRRSMTGQEVDSGKELVKYTMTMMINNV